MEHIEGNAVFCTDNFPLALSHSDVLVDPLDGKRYKIILQHRVNPNKIQMAGSSEQLKHYWYIPSQRDIRAYCVCVFQIQ